MFDERVMFRPSDVVDLLRDGEVYLSVGYGAIAWLRLVSPHQMFTLVPRPKEDVLLAIDVPNNEFRQAARKGGRHTFSAPHTGRVTFNFEPGTHIDVTISRPGGVKVEPFTVSERERHIPAGKYRPY